MDFIPANESRFYIRFFYLVTRFLLKLRFKHVWIKQDYHPGEGARTVYFINHNLWWDGLLPLYLNCRYFKQQARAIMEDRQMKQYSFFARIGAFSIKLDDPRASLQSLRYALSSMDRPDSCLFIYPEGELKAVSEKKPEFKEGLAWIYQKLKDVDFVPISFYSHSFRGSKAELYINIGNTCTPDPGQDRKRITSKFEEALHQMLIETREVAGTTDEGFIKT